MTAEPGTGVPFSLSGDCFSNGKVIEPGLLTFRKSLKRRIGQKAQYLVVLGVATVDLEVILETLGYCHRIVFAAIFAAVRKVLIVIYLFPRARVLPGF